MWMYRTYDASGFTLLEVMVAVAIIALALVAALGSQSQGVTLANESKFATTAAFLAQSKLAELEVLDYEDLNSDSGDFGDDYPGYSWKADISEGTTLGGVENIGEYIKKVNVIVFRPDESGYEYHFNFYRYVPKEED